MSTPTPSSRAEFDEKGVRRLGLGAGLGFAGAVALIVLPLTFLFLAAHSPSGFFTFSSGFVEVTSILVIAGALLLLFSLLVYRRSFAALRKADSRFLAASILCIIGSVGFLLLLVTAAVVAGNTGSLLTCVRGQASHALSCLESGQPFGAVTALLGFLLGWLGGLGIVIGLFLAGGRFRAGAFTGAGVVYALLLLLLVAPFLALFAALPGISYLVLVAPIFAVVAPALALAGSLGAAKPSAASP
ncbi:MAG: hypothetical protein ACRECT_00915 [Thermoplasmata archaeon]